MSFNFFSGPDHLFVDSESTSPNEAYCYVPLEPNREGHNADGGSHSVWNDVGHSHPLVSPMEGWHNYEQQHDVSSALSAVANDLPGPLHRDPYATVPGPYTLAIQSSQDCLTRAELGIQQSTVTPTSLPLSESCGAMLPPPMESSPSTMAYQSMEEGWSAVYSLTATSPPSPDLTNSYYTSFPHLSPESHDTMSFSGFARRRSVSEPWVFSQSYPMYDPSPVDLLPQPQPQPTFTTRRRNAAVPTPYTPHLLPNQWKCPYCTYVQKGRRKQDLRRHVATHTRPAHVAYWSCCGVPLSQAAQAGVPEDRIANAEATATEFYEGECLVGGCGQVFSRRDALQRHLREKKGVCFGNHSAPWHPGNNVERRSMA
ncbi:hypothetical protein C8Q80DRAFT_1116906 [Daedaleopsis nitida]|nr:hypothetical protein C8Q80DRAFT_1116906 [Daedaleopsis nitida]